MKTILSLYLARQQRPGRSFGPWAVVGQPGLRLCPQPRRLPLPPARRPCGDWRRPPRQPRPRPVAHATTPSLGNSSLADDTHSSCPAPWFPLAFLSLPTLDSASSRKASSALAPSPPSASPWTSAPPPPPTFSPVPSAPGLSLRGLDGPPRCPTGLWHCESPGCSEQKRLLAAFPPPQQDSRGGCPLAIGAERPLKAASPLDTWRTGEGPEEAGR